MVSAPAFPIPVDEDQRLRDLERHGIIGMASDIHFDRIVELASSLFDVPISLISLVTADRQLFLSRHGLEISETPRSVAFCAHAINSQEVMVVPNALNDERFCANPLVVGEPYVRFYAGAPLRSVEGHNLGTLCVIDRQPRQITAAQTHQLQLLADLVMHELELRRQASLCPVTGLPTRQAFLVIGEREFRRARADGHPLALLVFDIDNFRQINNRWGHLAGDQVLLDLCRLGRTFLREQDYAARLGDEEFGLLLVDMDSVDALNLAEQLRLAVHLMPGVHRHSDVVLNISGGLTGLGPSDPSFAALLQRADRALALAKTNGRNQVACLWNGL